MIALLLACASPPTLDSPALEDRWRAFNALDLDQLEASGPALLDRIRAEPDPALRQAILRVAGVTQDEGVRAELVRQLDGPDAVTAAESLTLDIPAGCEALAARCESWLPQAEDPYDPPPACGVYVSALNGRAPRCLPVVQARGSVFARAATAITLERVPARDPVPVADKATFTHARYAWVEVHGVAHGATITLPDGLEVAVFGERGHPLALPDGEVTLQGVSLPNASPSGAAQLHRAIQVATAAAMTP